jgi:Lar family restriction alleviation protein
MEVSTTIELESCPFCGRHYAQMCKDHPTDFYFFVKCWRCGARTQSEYTEEMAARRWNRRKQ